MSDLIRRIFTATLIIGPSGQGKTSLAATFSEYLWETYRKVLLFKSCDGGAFPTIIQKRIRQGLIRAWRMRTRSSEGLAFETCHLAAKGYWPRQINPETGETAPAVVLVPPVTTRYALHCSKGGHPLKIVPSVHLIVPTFCSECKEMVAPASMTIQESAQQTRGFEQVGGEFFDGLTSMCGWFMGELDTSRGHGAIGGEKPPLGGPVLSGGVKFGGNNRADYGFAQTRAYQIVHNALSIPNLVEGPVFTALPDDVVEGGGQLPIVGPKLAGSAMTADALQWFGNALETRIEKSEQGWDVRRLYLSEFIDSQNRRHLLKNSGPGTLPKYLEDPPIDPKQPNAKLFFSGFNLGHFFRLLDKELRDALAADDLQDTPGMASAPGQYGEAPAGDAAASARAVETPTAARAPAPAAPAAPTPRARTRPAQTPAVAAAQAPTPAAPAPSTPAPPVAPVAAAVAAPAPPTPAAAAPTGTAAPPPPGLRPPHRAPGS